MNTDNTAQDNAEPSPLRSRLRRARAGLPSAERDRGSLLMRGRLYTWLGLARDAAGRGGQPGPQSVAAFWPMPDEPDLRPLLTQWAESGITVALPVVGQRHAPLEFRRWTPGTAMRAGAYGISEPQDTDSVLPDVVLVPTLGYTDRADRVGYGAGYYDRTLAALRQRGHPHVSIGIAWECGRIDDPDYRPAAHDIALDAILTPAGWVPAAP